MNFEIMNLNPNNGFTLRPADCEKEFLGIYDNWWEGGESQHYGWWFRCAYSFSRFVRRSA